jgi:hypothetical protein
MRLSGSLFTTRSNPSCVSHDVKEGKEASASGSATYEAPILCTVGFILMRPAAPQVFLLVSLRSAQGHLQVLRPPAPLPRLVLRPPVTSRS